MQKRIYGLTIVLSVLGYLSWAGLAQANGEVGHCRNPDAFSAGENIQEAVLDKDLDALYSFVSGELESGPRREFVRGKDFDDVFPDDWRQAVLAEAPPCESLRGGFMLARGYVWYILADGGEPRIISLNGAVEEIPEEARSSEWVYKDQPLKGACFTTVWRSGDNYQTFHDEYVSDIEYKKFRDLVGRFIGKEIPLSASLSPWSDMWGTPDSIQLSNSVPECQKEVDQETMEELEWIHNKTYQVIKQVPSSYCEELAPNLKSGCEQVALLTLQVPSGAKTDVRTALYGIIEEDATGEAYVVPLVNFRSEADALNYLEKFESSERSSDSSDNTQSTPSEWSEVQTASTH